VVVVNEVAQFVDNYIFELPLGAFISSVLRVICPFEAQLPQRLLIFFMANCAFSIWVKYLLGNLVLQLANTFSNQRAAFFQADA